MENFFYRVKNFDTVRSLSKKFQIPSTLIIYQNRLTEEICEGDILYLTKSDDIVYKVDLLDTAESVAKKFGVSVQEILDKNKTPYLIYGEIIII